MKAHAIFTSLKPQQSRARIDKLCRPISDIDPPIYSTYYGAANDLYNVIKGRWPDVIDVRTSTIESRDFSFNTAITKLGLSADAPFCIVSDFAEETRYWRSSPTERYRDGFPMNWTYNELSLIYEQGVIAGLASQIPPWVRNTLRVMKIDKSSSSQMPNTITLEEARDTCEFLEALWQKNPKFIEQDLGQANGNLPYLLDDGGCDEYFPIAVRIFSATIIDRLIELAINNNSVSSLERKIFNEIEDNLPFWLRSGGVEACNVPPF